MSIEVKVPGVGESVQEGMIASWSKQTGDWIEQDDVLCELETDKATVEIAAENSGKLEVLSEAGKVVKVGDVIARIDTSAKAGDSETKTKTPDKTETNPSATKTQTSTPKDSSNHGPAVRRMVDELNIDVTKIEGRGKDGRVTKGDVLSAIENKTVENTSSTSSKQETKSPSRPTVREGAREVTREPMSMLRRKIAERLVSSQKTAATLTTFNEVDMTAVMDLRKRYKDHFEKRYGIKLGFMSFFLKASIFALREFPRVNASIEKDDIIYHHYYDIGVAVSTEKGLMVPVLKNVESMPLHEIEQSINDFSLKARNNKISIDDLSGGTFTVSNGGIFGSLVSTPILNPPQTGILGMHKIQQRPMVMPDGSIQARPMMYLALSYDHRLIDGKEAVQFLVKVKEAIEDPSRLLLGV